MRMRLHDYRFTDYRLAAYVVVAAVIAGGVAFGLDRAFAPTLKVEANGGPPSAAADGSGATATAVSASGGAVRQIPIAKTNAADLGDPDGKLTPVYPTSPGKDLPIKDTPVIQAVKPAAAATTTGSASVGVQPAAPVANAPVAAAPVANAPLANATPVATASAPAANACNIAACAAAYRSFRESDCSYQPMVGARRTCEGAPGLGGPSSTGPVASQPPMQSQQQASQPPQQSRPQYDQRGAATVGRSSRYDDALRDAERTVRRLPRQGQQFDDDDDDRIVQEAPEQRYDLRRNWVSEPQD